MKLITLLLVALLAAGPLPTLARAQGASAPVVERVEIMNNQYLQKETLLFYVSTKPGDRYDEDRLKEDFRRLWDTGFLDDLAIEVLDGAQGKIVRFRVVERKRIQIVDFRGSKELSNSTIEEALEENDAQIRIDSFYDPAKARRVEALLKAMLEAKGRPFAEVKHEAKNIGGSGQQLSFVIDDGPRAKIQEIEFDGNEVFSDDKLRGELKKLKPSGFFNLSWLGGKTTYTDEKWLGGGEDPGGDRGRLEDFYLDHGYVTVRIGQPRIVYTDGKSGFFKKKPVKFMKLVIPVEEGEQYRLGELKFEGLTVLKEEFVRGYIKIREGEVYNDSKFKKAFEKLRDLYGSLGYFQWTGATERTPDAERNVVDVVVRMDEDQRYFVGKIDFAGNDSTRDKVIRREIYMNEGDVFNTEALKLSIKRVNQLGYFKPMEGAPDIRPNPDAENKVDVTFNVEEQNRNQFTFGGGVSGLEGTFINASFSTTNFLGAGETFSIYAQSGKRTKNYQLSISEPYFLDRPITAGIDLFSRKITYLSYYNTAGYTQKSTGVSFTTGTTVGKWSRAFLNYAYEVIELSDLDTSELEDDYYPGLSGGVQFGPTYDPLYFGDYGKRKESRITPSIVYNTVDNPWSPRAGMKHSATLSVAGGLMGGTVDYVRPNLEAIVYVPHTSRTALGVRAQAAWILPYGDTNVLPYYQRYFLGGETQVRGYPIRSIGPIGATGRALGGDKFLLFNAEYYLDVFGPLRMLAFFDAGQAYLKNEPMDPGDLKISWGVEARFIMPVLNVPFRLIYAVNPNRSPYEEFYVDRTTFKFAVGTTF